MTSSFKERFTTDNAGVVLVDHQTGTIGWVYSLPKQTVINSTRVLARMAVTYNMPLLLTTTMEEYVGPTMPELVAVAEDAFAKRFKRGGEVAKRHDRRRQGAIGLVLLRAVMPQANLVLSALFGELVLEAVQPQLRVCHRRIDQRTVVRHRV